MNRTLTFMLTATMILSLVAVSGSAMAAQDQWPDDCDDAPIIDSGQYSGAIDTPEDADSFRLRMDKGEYYGFRLIVPREKADFHFHAIGRGHGVTNVSGRVSLTDISGAENIDHGVRYPIGNFQPGVEATWKAFAEQDSVHCFYVRENSPDSAEIPYEWQMSIEKNNPEPAGFEITDLQNQVDNLQSQINDLQSQLDDKDDSISVLQSLLDDKDDTISDLRSQLENAEVTIDISVEPEDQATFQVGGEMAVSVTADGTSPSDVTLDFAGEQYTASGGEATIPLESAGPQQLSIEYKDTTESVTIDVTDSETDSTTEDDDSSTTDDSDTDDDSSSTVDSSTGDDTSSSDSQDTSGGTSGGSDDGFGSGFGLVVALGAFMSLGLLSLRRRQ